MKFSTPLRLSSLLGLFVVSVYTNAQSFEKTEVAKANVILKTTHSWDSSPIKYPDGEAQVTVVTLNLAPGASTGWHRHDAPSVVYVVDGTLEVRMKNGKIHPVQKGESFVEVVNQDHNAVNVGDLPLMLLVVYAGAVGQTLLEKVKQ